ncbi:hypothetical protein Psch_03297 [Pelotomaculum schinkii]|uniref:Uncharacterized protein n=1 Tax=Pelotomaculum schinkii TaxID=78350 RepID=A0A4Y7R6R8_9FIRM|nr:hypothetical protein Psch_03297 [Pelotomaculum schinkii]TEB15018.1 hypothetical protein Psfp_02465 [Pelotomaculum sp. FP]
MGKVLEGILSLKGIMVTPPYSILISYYSAFSLDSPNLLHVF